ncbi:oligosaccharide flippase family protein [Polaribacter sp. MED152]|uniref:oligosaccharide flippase family protein n=1 Tax=Polaribacter sp. MED152 TaxID=313598 RepID=UPI000068C58F|nr:oligosaccharide flippase family protein [Polaribacter sp. MED152]EAQ43168.3 polysaccharide transporter [Polaribacter sp. MED152]
MKLIKKNFIYNNLYNLVNLLIPLIIFPYISRIFGPVGLGKISFTISLVSTFVIISSLGIPIYGIREISKVKNDKILLSKTFIEVFSIQLIWLIIIMLFYGIWISFTNTFQGDYILKIVSFFHLVGLVCIINWFYQGIENYRFVTIVNVGIKFLTIILVFLFVNNEDQYWLYYCILVGPIFLAFILSLINTKQHLIFSLKNLSLKKHVKSIGIIFATQVAIGVYTNLSIVFLKYFSNDEQVGFFTPALRLVKISTTVITALGIVLIPKITEFVKNNNITECNLIIVKSIKYTFLVSSPLVVLIYLNANEIILIFAGENFNQSIVLLKYLTPLIIFIGLSNIFGLQILIPFHKEKLYLYAVVLGSVFSIFLNYFLMTTLQSKGAVYAILITEFIIALCTGFYAIKTLSFRYPFKTILIYVFLSLLFIPITLFTGVYFKGWVLLIVNFGSCFLLYFFGLILFNERFFIDKIFYPVFKIQIK